MIGANREDNGSGANAGSVYVFRSIGGQWMQVAKLVAPDGQAEDFFGDVALDGNTAVVGASGDDDQEDRTGAAYIF